MKRYIFVFAAMLVSCCITEVKAQGYVINKANDTKIVLAAKDVNNIQAVANPVATNLDYYTKEQIDSMRQVLEQTALYVKAVAMAKVDSVQQVAMGMYVNLQTAIGLNRQAINQNSKDILALQDSVARVSKEVADLKTYIDQKEVEVKNLALYYIDELRIYAAALEARIAALEAKSGEDE